MDAFMFTDIFLELVKVAVCEGGEEALPICNRERQNFLASSAAIAPGAVISQICNADQFFVSFFKTSMGTFIGADWKGMPS